MQDAINPTKRRLLAVSDHIASTLFRAEASESVGRVDLLLSCGDLSYSYLEYLVTNLGVRDAFYVHGNHDAPEVCHNGMRLVAPGGWENLDKRCVRASSTDLLVAGMEGSIRYRPDARYQYTQRQMVLRAQRLILRLLFNRVVYGRYLDIFIAHSPPAGIHDGPDGPHKGFEFFLTIMRYFRPRLFLHGHKHRYGPMPWHTTYYDTEVVNVYPFRIIEWQGDQVTYGRLYCR